MQQDARKSIKNSKMSLDIRKQAKANIGSDLVVADEFDMFDITSLESMGIHLLFGEIDNYTIREAITFILKANILLEDNITLMLNTVGGDVAEGFGLIDIMQSSRLPIRTVGMGNIISMGMLIICAGTTGERIMLKNTSAMAHQFASYSDGKFHELVAQHKSNVYLKEQFIQHFLRHTAMSKKQINDIIFSPSDRYLTPAECKKYGLIDKVVDQLPAF